VPKRHIGEGRCTYSEVVTRQLRTRTVGHRHTPVSVGCSVSLVDTGTDQVDKMDSCAPTHRCCLRSHRDRCTDSWRLYISGISNEN